MKIYKVYNDDLGVEVLFTSKSEAEKYAEYLNRYYNKDFYELVANPTPNMNIPLNYPFHVLEDIVYNTAKEAYK